MVRFVAIALVAFVGASAAGAGVGHAGPKPGQRAPAKLAALAPAEDARRAVVIGIRGEVYEPDGKGAWIHRLASTTADPVEAAGRTAVGGARIVALAGGAIYRLAGNGWSAIRLRQRGKAILGTGTRAVAAVGRQLFALDELTKGEPTRLATASAPILAIGAGARGLVIATDAGLVRLTAGKLVALPAAPRRAKLVGERWAVVDRGAVDLTTNRLTAWPAGLAIGVATTGPNDALVVVASSHAGLELVTLARGKLVRDSLGVTGTAVGVVLDRAGRAAVALADGRVAVRERSGWSTVEVSEEIPSERPGSPPALSGPPN